MSKPFDTIESGKFAAVPGFQVRDIIRFFAVDLVIALLVNIFKGLGFFPSADTYVLVILASKTILFFYLLWLIRLRREAWPATGAVTFGRWWAWPLCLVLYIAAYPLLLWADGLNQTFFEHIYAWFGLQYGKSSQAVVGLIFEDAIASPTRMALIAFTVLLGPFMEELAFRGMGLDAFRRVDRLWLAIFWTSILFGLFHFDLHLLMPLSLLGALFAAVRLISGSLWCAVAIHCLHNGLTLAILAYALGEFVLPEWVPTF